MGYACKILADSVSPDGVRLTTLEVTFPRIVLAEFNTHRVLSRNSASSRAIPVEKRIAQVKADPFVPAAFGKNRPGMQASENLQGDADLEASVAWNDAMSSAISGATWLARIGVHKQLANRLLEPFLWHTVIVSATEWENFFALRCHPDAQPEIRTIAEMMRYAMSYAAPQPIGDGEWHLPYVDRLIDADAFENLPPHEIAMVSCGRCARVSYLTHDGRRDQSSPIHPPESPRAQMGSCGPTLEVCGQVKGPPTTSRGGDSCERCCRMRTTSQTRRRREKVGRYHDDVTRAALSLRRLPIVRGAGDASPDAGKATPQASGQSGHPKRSGERIPGFADGAPRSRGAD